MNSTFQVIVNIVLPIFGLLFCAINSSKIAYKKNRDTETWFWLGLYFGIIALIIIYFLKPLKIIKKTKNISINSLNNKFAVLKADNNYWYYLDNEKKQIGPMSLSKLYDSYLKGIVSSYTYVWNDTMDNWKKLIDVPTLRNLKKIYQNEK